MRRGLGSREVLLNFGAHPCSVTGEATYLIKMCSQCIHAFFLLSLTERNVIKQQI